MKTFFDQTMGRRLPQAFELMELCEVQYLLRMFERPKISPGMPDVDWLPIVAKQGWLIITNDVQLLTNRDERAAIIENSAGLVILRPGTSPVHEELMFLLRRFHWLAEIDALPRPFAFTTTLRGKPRQADLSRI